jgi:hypothetical protein
LLDAALARLLRGQQHHVNQSSTTRLELARLLFADFDPAVRGIAQPFLLKAVVEGQARKHIPDDIVITEHGPVVVDVKPHCRLSTPAVAFTFA